MIGKCARRYRVILLAERHDQLPRGGLLRLGLRSERWRGKELGRGIAPELVAQVLVSSDFFRPNPLGIVEALRRAVLRAYGCQSSAVSLSAAALGAPFP